MSGEKGYTYKPAAGSILFRNVLSPTYNRLTPFVPAWWTPNQMTVTGIVMTTAASCILLKSFYNDVALTQTECLLVAFLNFTYMCLDNLDGKHARATKQSSPIGEYLDHGGDCYTSLLSTWCMFRLANVPERDYTMLILAFSTALVHFFHLVTGESTLGGDFFSADEGMITFWAVPLVHAFYPSTWSIVLFTEGQQLGVSGYTVEAPFTLPLTTFCVGIYFLGQLSCICEMVAAVREKVLHPLVIQVATTVLLLGAGIDNSVPWTVLAAILLSFTIHYIIVGGCVKYGDLTCSTDDTRIHTQGKPRDRSSDSLRGLGRMPAPARVRHAAGLQERGMSHALCT